jgi:hypothetical protein
MPDAIKDNRDKLLERAMSRHQYSGDSLIEVLQRRRNSTVSSAPSVSGPLFLHVFGQKTCDHGGLDQAVSP